MFIVLHCIVMLLLVVAIVVTPFLDWKGILNYLTKDYNHAGDTDR